MIPFNEFPLLGVIKIKSISVQTTAIPTSKAGTILKIKVCVENYLKHLLDSFKFDYKLKYLKIKN